MNAQSSITKRNEFISIIRYMVQKMREGRLIIAPYAVSIKADIESVDSTDYIYDMIKWCQNNCRGRWRWTCDLFNSSVVFEFESDYDAALFKLHHY